jgi:hypothetical protein
MHRQPCRMTAMLDQLSEELRLCRPRTQSFLIAPVADRARFENSIQTCARCSWCCYLSGTDDRIEAARSSPDVRHHARPNDETVPLGTYTCLNSVRFESGNLPFIGSGR